MTQSSDPFRLLPHPALRPPSGPVVLLILDGVGEGRHDAWDAVSEARTPNLRWLRENGLWRLLKAHGTAVGLPSDADMGNSEVGHNTLGAGRVFDQGAKLVDTAIETQTIWGATWQKLTQPLTGSGQTLHLIGLLSDGNVHSHEAHVHALVRRADADGVGRVRLHILTDGRDVLGQSAEVYIHRLERLLETIRRPGQRDYRIASGGGRMVTTMDRYEADWSIVERGWNAHVHGQARPFRDALEAIRTLRAEQPGINDQFLAPFVIVDDTAKPVGPIRDGDSVIFWNFRGDRAIEISKAFTSGESFDKFSRGACPDVRYAGMMMYDGDLKLPELFLVAPPAAARTMGEFLAKNRITQFACSETQKFGHVTYFWNGNRSGMFDQRYERYLEVPSDRVPFEQRPWMKSAECADETIRAIDSGEYRFLRINFAAGDMVGHTGDLEAAIAAVQAIDLSVGRVLQAVARQQGTLVITADHGNCDDMVERDKHGAPLYDAAGKPVMKTSHSLAPVVFNVWDAGGRQLALDASNAHRGLSSVAATLTELLGYRVPDGWEPSLLLAEERATRS
jgi:2,3-bisphosphoglycerate-independent phosphoglycerate mutase